MVQQRPSIKHVRHFLAILGGGVGKVTRCPTQREKGTLAKGKQWGTKACIGNGTALSVMLSEAYVCKRCAPMCVRIRLWPPRRDDSSHVVIGAAGTWAL